MSPIAIAGCLVLAVIALAFLGLLLCAAAPLVEAEAPGAEQKDR